MASRVDVDRCSASRASLQQDGFAAVMTNSGISSALDLACANMFPSLHGACTICAGQESRSVFWKLPEREAPHPKICSCQGFCQLSSLLEEQFLGYRASRSSNFQDTECDGCPAHMLKAPCSGRNALAHARSRAEEVPQFVVTAAISSC